MSAETSLVLLSENEEQDVDTLIENISHRLNLDRDSQESEGQSTDHVDDAFESEEYELLNEVNNLFILFGEFNEEDKKHLRRKEDGRRENLLSICSIQKCHLLNHQTIRFKSFTKRYQLNWGGVDINDQFTWSSASVYYDKNQYQESLSQRSTAKKGAYKDEAKIQAKKEHLKSLLSPAQRKEKTSANALGNYLEDDQIKLTEEESELYNTIWNQSDAHSDLEKISYGFYYEERKNLGLMRARLLLSDQLEENDKIVSKYFQQCVGYVLQLLKMHKGTRNEESQIIPLELVPQALRPVFSALAKLEHIKALGKSPYNATLASTLATKNRELMREKACFSSSYVTLKGKYEKWAKLYCRNFTMGVKVGEKVSDAPFAYTSDEEDFVNRARRVIEDLESSGMAEEQMKEYVSALEDMFQELMEQEKHLESQAKHFYTVLSKLHFIIICIEIQICMNEDLFEKELEESNTTFDRNNFAQTLPLKLIKKYRISIDVNFSTENLAKEVLAPMTRKTHEKDTEKSKKGPSNVDTPFDNARAICPIWNKKILEYTLEDVLIAFSTLAQSESMVHMLIKRRGTEEERDRYKIYFDTYRAFLFMRSTTLTAVAWPPNILNVFGYRVIHSTETQNSETNYKSPAKSTAIAKSGLDDIDEDMDYYEEARVIGSEESGKIDVFYKASNRCYQFLCLNYYICTLRSDYTEAMLPLDKNTTRFPSSYTDKIMGNRDKFSNALFDMSINSLRNWFVENPTSIEKVFANMIERLIENLVTPGMRTWSHKGMLGGIKELWRKLLKDEREAVTVLEDFNMGACVDIAFVYSASVDIRIKEFHSLKNTDKGDSLRKKQREKIEEIIDHFLKFFVINDFTWLETIEQFVTHAAAIRSTGHSSLGNKFRCDKNFIKDVKVYSVLQDKAQRPMIYHSFSVFRDTIFKECFMLLLANKYQKPMSFIDKYVIDHSEMYQPTEQVIDSVIHSQDAKLLQVSLNEYLLFFYGCYVDTCYGLPQAIALWLSLLNQEVVIGNKQLYNDKGETMCIKEVCKDITSFIENETADRSVLKKVFDRDKMRLTYAGSLKVDRASGFASILKKGVDIYAKSWSNTNSSKQSKEEEERKAEYASNLKIPISEIPEEPTSGNLTFRLTSLFGVNSKYFEQDLDDEGNKIGEEREMSIEEMLSERDKSIVMKIAQDEYTRTFYNKFAKAQENNNSNSNNGSSNSVRSQSSSKNILESLFESDYAPTGSSSNESNKSNTSLLKLPSPTKKTVSPVSSKSKTESDSKKRTHETSSKQSVYNTSRSKIRFSAEEEEDEEDGEIEITKSSRQRTTLLSSRRDEMEESEEEGEIEITTRSSKKNRKEYTEVKASDANGQKQKKRAKF